MVWVVKLCLPVSHLEISESRLLSNRAKSFWVSPLAFRISLMRLAIPKDKSNSAFCSAGIDALLNVAKIIFLLITYSLISEQLRIIVIRIHYGAKQYTTTQIIPPVPWLRVLHMAHLLWWVMLDSLHLVFGAMEPLWCITYRENILKICQRCWGQKYYH